MAYVHGNKLGTRLLEALGIPSKGVSRVVLECSATDAAKLTIESYVLAESADHLETIATEYRVVEQTPAEG